MTGFVQMGGKHITHARTHPVSMYFPSQHFMVLLVDDVVSRPITPEIHLLSLTIFAQEALVTLICMNLVLVTLICMNLSDTHVQITCGCVVNDIIIVR